jgi:HD-GYP domain-containing protein (c-di-GMP phosphodiesterase class II)
MQTIMDDSTNFQRLLTEAVRSITQCGLHLITEYPLRFMRMRELPLPEYIPGLADDLKTPAYFEVLRAAQASFGVKAQGANRKQVRALQLLFRQVIVETAEANHWPPPIDDHAWRTGRIAVAVGKELGLPRPGLNELFWAGWLHDVGKLFILELADTLEAQGVNFEIILPLIRTHASLGGLLLESVYPLFTLGPICAVQHQESVDGTGYQGLHYEQLSAEGCIVGLADSYDATVTRVAWSAARVCEENRQQYARAGHPDDVVLMAFLRVVERYHTHWYPEMG